ncbi:LPS assembly lipoprotein LptE [Roseovarius nitratireducens]|uniref:LPS assembly lipoprotein LptE n=1 Tax=Roseovarius nitratireducens TaxID=2044597 RepID=UPI000CE16A96|nr:LPS assembly lipoprotein LptE [Roseovarius nitratireducens]
MSSSDRRLFLFSGLAALAGCGFAPVYGPGGGGDALMGRVRVTDPHGRAGFLLTREIEARLGRPETPRYELRPAIALRSEAIAIDRSNVAARANLIGTVNYTLTDLETGEKVDSGKVTNFTGYSTFDTPIVTRAAARDAEARLMQMLADQMLTRLAAAAASRSR